MPFFLPQLQGRRTAAFEFIPPCSSGSILRVWIRISPSLHMHMHTKQQQAAIGVGDIGLRYHFRRQVASIFCAFFSIISIILSCFGLLYHSLTFAVFYPHSTHNSRLLSGCIVEPLLRDVAAHAPTPPRLTCSDV